MLHPHEFSEYGVIAEAPGAAEGSPVGGWHYGNLNRLSQATCASAAGIKRYLEALNA